MPWCDEAHAEKKNTGKITKVEITQTDQGNGATYCGACGHVLPDYHEPAEGEICENCGAEFIGTSVGYGNIGGSDF